MTTAVAVVLQARMGSRRLPAKSLADLCGRSLLGHCIWRLKMSGLPVVLATTDQAEDDPLVVEAERAGARVVRGSAEDVLSRYVGAADACGATYVIRATADNPAVDLDAPNRVLTFLRRTGADHVIDCGLPIGGTVEAVTTDALRRAANLAVDPYDREHVTPFLRRDRRFTVIRSIGPALVRRPGLRLTVDTADDLDFMRAVLEPVCGPTDTGATYRHSQGSRATLARAPRPADRDRIGGVMREPRGILSAFGLVLGVAVIAAAQLSGGGELRMLAQPTALLVVFGGTAAALMVSFPTRTLGRAVLTALRAFTERTAATPEALVATFLQLAHKARREGVMALEADIVRAGDAFVARALALASSGLEPDLLRHTLEIDSRTAAERADELAEVFESAAGYAPTLGIVGAVLGLMGVMGHMTSTGSIGEGIAAAFVATIYGVGAANLIFLPIATRLRVRARMEALRRAITIDGILALHDRLQPSLVEERLTGYLRQPSGDGRQVAA